MAISIQLIIVLSMMVGFNFYCIVNNKWYQLFSVLFMVLLFMPTDALGIISGSSYSTPGIFNVSLICYNVIIIYLILIILNKIKVRRKNKFVFTTILLSLDIIFIIRFFTDGINALSNKMFDNFLIPALLGLLIIEYLPKDKLGKILRNIYFFIMINAIIASLEYFLGKSIFFHQYYMDTTSWYESVYVAQQYGISFRSTAFLGHPLLNGMYYMIAAIYLFNSRDRKNNVFSFFQLLILTFAIFTTNSRMTIFVFVLYIIYYILYKKMYVKFAGILFIGVLVVLLIDFNSIYTSLFSRDKTGSSILVRLQAIKSIGSIPIKTLLLGCGYNNAKSILDNLGFISNFEISYLIILVENGIIAFSSWIMCFLSLYNSRMYKKFVGIDVKNMLNNMIICILVLALTSNMFGDPGTINYILWTIIAFTVVVGDEKQSKLGVESTCQN